jgi:hypothetical protein
VRLFMNHPAAEAVAVQPRFEFTARRLGPSKGSNTTYPRRFAASC